MDLHVIFINLFDIANNNIRHISHGLVGSWYTVYYMYAVSYQIGFIFLFNVNGFFFPSFTSYFDACRSFGNNAVTKAILNIYKNILKLMYVFRTFYFVRICSCSIPHTFV